jgi:hypothetical protein
MSEVTSRPADCTEEDCKAIFRLLLEMHKEVARHEINPNKAFAEVYWCVKDGAAYIVELDGVPVGTAGFRIGSPWFSDEELFSDQWFYVLKEHRSDSRILKALLTEVRELANTTGAAVQFKLYDPARPSKSKSSAIAEDFFFQPVGKLHRTEPSTSE